MASMGCRVARSRVQGRYTLEVYYDNPSVFASD